MNSIIGKLSNCRLEIVYYFEDIGSSACLRHLRNFRIIHEVVEQEDHIRIIQNQVYIIRITLIMYSTRFQHNIVTLSND